MTTLNQPGKGKNITSWILQCLTAIAFLGAAGAKIASVQMLVDVFNQIGIGQWFRYITAALEILGAIALLTPRFAAFGALLLATTMFFAVLTHLLILHTSPAAAIVLMLLSAAILWLRRYQISQNRFLLMSRA
jgi:putative oxidoreductase